MVALQLNINDFKPVLTNSALEEIAKQAMQELDVYNYGDQKSFIAETLNGFHIEVTVDYKGMNYRRISLYYCEICKYDKVTESYGSDDDCEIYTDILKGYLYDKISDLNEYDEAYYYENEKMYAI